MIHGTASCRNHCGREGRGNAEGFAPAIVACRGAAVARGHVYVDARVGASARAATHGPARPVPSLRADPLRACLMGKGDAGGDGGGLLAGGGGAVMDEIFARNRAWAARRLRGDAQCFADGAATHKPRIMWIGALGCQVVWGCFSCMCVCAYV